MIIEELRSYEVSIWTLQDEFITVLKWSDVEQKGRIENPRMTLDVDGTRNFTFSIPMYFYDNGTLVENPNWYNTKNKNLQVNMRKIKVIFNKWKSSQQVFEFLITKVTETHENDQLTCNVECEGLAFNELGKIGYNLSLSSEIFQIKYEKWQDEGSNPNTKPIQNIQYWCEECLNLDPKPTGDNAVIDPTKWYYSIQMDWSYYSDCPNRKSNKLYEEAYASSWSDSLVPETVEKYQEKARPVEVSESNLYNITQTIAETFGVYCRYEYGYDDNFHIISRTIVFFNNYMKEKSGVISLSYPYQSKRITREMDSAEIVTKLYVRDADDSSVVLGKASITDCPANKTKENYILNFDYLYSIGTITSEQYKGIKTYETAIRKLNTKLIKAQQKQTTYQSKIPEVEAAITVAKNSITIDDDQISQNQEVYNALDIEDDDDDGYIEIKRTNPEFCGISQDKNNKYYLNVANKKKGMHVSTLKIWKYFSTVEGQTASIANTEYKGGKIVYDSYGNPSKIENIKPFTDSNGNEHSGVYLTYKYKPQLYYDNIINTWKTKLYKDTQKLIKNQKKLYDYITYTKNNTTYVTAINKVNNTTYEVYNDGPNIIKEVATLEEAYALMFKTAGYGTISGNTFTLSSALGGTAYPNYKNNTEFVEILRNLEINNEDVVHIGLQTQLEQAIELCDKYISDKMELMYKFQYMMGPALREGYWQPDEYKDYGDKHVKTGNFSKIFSKADLTRDTGEDLLFCWDNDLFDDEQDICYKYSILETNKYYPCVNISTIYNQIKDNITNYSFIFNSNQNRSSSSDEINITDLRTYKIGSEAKLVFIRYKSSDNTIVEPALVLVGADDLTSAQITFMKRNSTSSQAGGDPCLGIISTELNETTNEVDTTIESKIELGDNPIFWYFGTNTDLAISQFEAVYPRIRCSSLQLKTATDTLRIESNGKKLEPFIDYKTNTRNVQRSKIYYLEHFIALDPLAVCRNSTYTNHVGINLSLNIEYELSNAGTNIYLDALQVSKENAYPKVSYTIDPNILNETFMSTLYNKLNQLVMINDVQLKFENVFGYISHIELNLDAPWEDTIEVKNYKTKFEDLFSTIVAQTEQMKRNSEAIGAVISGRTPLKDVGLSSTLDSNYDIFTAYLDSYFDSSDVVKDKLASLFEEAGNIISDTKGTLNSIRALSMENASILGSFVRSVQELTVNVNRSTEQPTDFKVGDVWIQVDADGNEIGRYVATSDSENAKDGGGFTRTFDGTLAAIRGAALDIDAAAGTVAITAQNQIDIQSGKNVYIAAAGSVDIVGNESVNIGGTTINIGSTVIGEETVTGGINLVTAAYNSNSYSAAPQNNISKVLIHPNQIYMASSELRMYGTYIDMVASTGTASNTSAIRLDADEGIWIGSGKKVILSANVPATSNGTTTYGSDVELSPTHLLFGVNSGANATAVEMTSEYFILGSGSQNIQEIVTNGITGVSSKANQNSEPIDSVTGFKITKDGMGLAVSSNEGISAFMVSATALTLGNGIVKLDRENYTLDSATNNELRKATTTSGSYVRIANNGIELGGTSDLYVNMSNFKLQSGDYGADGTSLGSNIGTRFAVGQNLNNIHNINSLPADPTSSSAWVGIVYNKNGLYINGKIEATQFIAKCMNGYFKADGSSLGFYDTSNNAVLTLTSGGLTCADDFTLSSGKNLLIGSYTGSGNNQTLNGILITATGITIGASASLSLQSGGNLSINSTNLIINSQATGSNSIFALKEEVVNEDAGTTTYATVVSYSQTNGFKINTDNFKINPKGKGRSNPIFQISQRQLNSTTEEYEYVSILEYNTTDGLTMNPKKLSIDSNGIVNIQSSNFIIDSTAKNSVNSTIFAVTNGKTDNNRIAYLEIMTGNTTSTISASLCGWSLSPGKLSYDTVGMATGEDGSGVSPWTLWSGSSTPSSAPFRVDKDGNLYINKLMVQKEGSQEYEPVNLSGNFNQAVSVTGEWSGLSFQAKIKLFGKINKTVNMNTSVDVTNVAISQYMSGTSVFWASVKMKMTIEGKTSEEFSEATDGTIVNVWPAIRYGEKLGWNDYQSKITYEDKTYYKSGTYIKYYVENDSGGYDGPYYTYKRGDEVTVREYTLPTWPYDW